MILIDTHQMHSGVEQQLAQSLNPAQLTCATTVCCGVNTHSIDKSSNQLERNMTISQFLWEQCWEQNRVSKL
jgi:hypothetical protein